MHDFNCLTTECSEHSSAKVREQLPMLSFFFVGKVQEAKKHLEVVAKEAQDRNSRVAALRAAEQHARHNTVHRQEDQDDQNPKPRQDFFLIPLLFLIMFACFPKWLFAGSF